MFHLETYFWEATGVTLLKVIHLHNLSDGTCMLCLLWFPIL